MNKFVTLTQREIDIIQVDARIKALFNAAQTLRAKALEYKQKAELLRDAGGAPHVIEVLYACMHTCEFMSDKVMTL